VNDVGELKDFIGQIVVLLYKSYHMREASRFLKQYDIEIYCRARDVSGERCVSALVLACLAILRRT
jgi:hypothetical protein